MKKTTIQAKKDSSQIDEEKRDFLFVTTAGLAIAGGQSPRFLLLIQ